MGRQTNIAWTRSTLNTAWGCTKVTTECKQCYMFEFSKKIGVDPAVVRITKAGLTRAALEATIRQRDSPMFVNSMSDTFHKDIPPELLAMWFEVFAAHPEKVFQILTKRPERALAFFETRSVPPNCWVGTSVGIRAAKPRIDLLRQIDAPVRFLSCEPLLEDLGEMNLAGIHWVLIGGESDDKTPRPMDPAWAESLVEQCRTAGAAPFFKQMGGRGGDGAGGDLLNGRKIQEWPAGYSA